MLSDSVDYELGIILVSLNETPRERDEKVMIMNDSAVEGSSDCLSLSLSVNPQLPTILATVKLYSCLN
jgi:hypothetical protein